MSKWVSHISGPIPTELDDPIAPARRPQPRVRPGTAGESNYNSHRSGGYGPLLELQGRALAVAGATGPLGPTDTSAPFKTAPSQSKDHVRENVRRMREIQNRAKKREEQRSSPVKPVWQSQRFREIESRVDSSRGRIQYEDEEASSRRDFQSRNSSYHRSNSAGSLNVHGHGHGSRPSSAGAGANYLRAHSNSGPDLDPAMQTRPLTPVRKDVPPERISVPRASSAREVRLIRRDVDFVRANAHSAKSARSRTANRTDCGTLYGSGDLRADFDTERPESRGEAPLDYRRGAVPDYLRRRQNRWADEEARRVASQPDPDQPAGHRKLEDGERRRTLQLLKDTYTDLQQELCKMPIRTDTLRVRQRKEEVEKKMTELEEAIKIFSRPKVFIKDN